VKNEYQQRDTQQHFQHQLGQQQHKHLHQQITSVTKKLQKKQNIVKNEYKQRDRRQH
jgi:hypothetical protein